MASPKTEWALAELFESWAGVPPDLILPLAPSGSDRIYYRLQKNDKVAIGTYSPHAKESLAFLNFVCFCLPVIRISTRFVNLAFITSLTT